MFYRTRNWPKIEGHGIGFDPEWSAAGLSFRADSKIQVLNWYLSLVHRLIHDWVTYTQVKCSRQDCEPDSTLNRDPFELPRNGGHWSHTWLGIELRELGIDPEWWPMETELARNRISGPESAAMRIVLEDLLYPSGACISTAR